MADFAAMTWEDVRDLDRTRCVAILPVGAIEAHGPHLPLDTDVVIARSMARAGAKRLLARGQPSILLPALAYTAAGFAAGFPGTMSVSPQSVTGLVVDLARSLTGQGFPLLAVANAHLDPAHLESLEQAGVRIRADGLLRFAFPNISRKPWAQRLTEEFRSGACHAGRFETSVVLAAEPGVVRREIAATLESNPTSIGRAIRDGKRSFEEAGGPRAYFGDPAQATAEEGEQTIDTLGAILEDAVLEALSPSAGETR